MHDDAATACSTCIASANAASNAATRGPWATQPGRDDLADRGDLLRPEPGLHDVDAAHGRAPAVLSARPAAISLRSGRHQATSSRSPSSSPISRLEAQVDARGRRVGQPTRHAVDRAVRAVLDGQVGVHRPRSSAWASPSRLVSVPLAML